VSERMNCTSVPFLYNTLATSSTPFIPGVLGNNPAGYHDDSQKRCNDEHHYQLQRLYKEKQAHLQKLKDDEPVEPDYDPVEERRQMYAIPEFENDLRDEPHAADTRDEYEILYDKESEEQNEKLHQRAVNLAVKSKYKTPVDEVLSTSLLNGKSLKVYAREYVYCNAPYERGKQSKKRLHFKKAFLDAFHTFHTAHLRQTGEEIKIADYIVNYPTLEKVSRGHYYDPKTVTTSNVCTTPLTIPYTGFPASNCGVIFVVVVKLSRAALSATLPSNSSIVIEKSTSLINANFNIDTVSNITSSNANIASYDTIVDTGASAHVLKSILYGTNVRIQTNRNVALGDNSITLKITHMCDIGILIDAMVVPSITLNLISGARLDKQGYTLKFANGRGTIRKGTHVIRCVCYNDLYFCNLKDFLVIPEDLKCNNLVPTSIKLPEDVLKSTSKPTVTERLVTPATKPKYKPQRTISTTADLELLHKRFGHANIDSIVKGLKDKTIKGYDVTLKRSRTGKFELLNGKCECCMLSKSHLPSFHNSSTVKGRANGDYVVCDIQGPFAIESMGGERYVLTYTDFYSRHSWTYLLTQKSEAIQHLKHLVEIVFKAARIELRHYHSDGAGYLTQPRIVT